MMEENSCLEDKILPMRTSPIEYKMKKKIEKVHLKTFTVTLTTLVYFI